LKLLDRSIPFDTEQGLRAVLPHPLLASLFASRGATHVLREWGELLPASRLKGAPEAAVLLADAIERGERICVVADYDCDGATSCAVALRGLGMVGANVRFHVPNRFRTGYGLSPMVVDEVVATGGADWILTVDNGIASVDGVAHANALGMRVLVTDHHLPGSQIPQAACIVNPNQPGCTFPSKNLAGVGVMFYVLLALREELQRRGSFASSPAPDLEGLLDLVALGTVADVVRLDENNRLLVALGLARIRAGRMQVGVRALFEVAKRPWAQACTADFGFALGPRINAAGRLDDMTVGIGCLTTEDDGEARALATKLDVINRQRKEVEKTMRTQAEDLLAKMAFTPQHNTICLFSPEWHEGVVGIVAGRLKELHNRPTFAFARSDDGSIRGSGRSIPGLHLRDALDLVSKRAPGVLKKFGGHAMAAGCTLDAGTFERFAAVFDEVISEWMTDALREHVLETDGDLPQEWFTPEVAALLDAQVWGQGFLAPLFSSNVVVERQSQLGSSHTKATVRVLDGVAAGARRELIAWHRTAFLPERARIAWRLDVNEWNGRVSVRAILEAVES
jgi:single-stranded-DNA-specific exonuclease